jgi:hypothetical protein
MTAPAAGVNELPIDDPKGFSQATFIVVDPRNDLVSPYKVPIDVGYNSGGFVSGLKASASSALRLASPATLETGDAFYAMMEEDYRLQNGNLMLGNMVLAENFQAMTLTFLTVGKIPTSQWSTMRSAHVEITARTRTPDPGYTLNGGYRTIALSMDILLRNTL